MADVELKFDARDFRERVNRLAQALNVEPAEIIRQQFASAIRTIIRYTYPPNKTQGEKAVERDIRKIFTSPADMFPHGSRIPSLDKALKGAQWNTAATIISNLPKFQNLQVADSVDSAIHKSAKTSRGSIPKGAKTAVLIRDPSILAAYIAKIKERVGVAKSGWLSAARQFKAQGVASWVSRHGSGQGESRDTLRGSTGFVEGVNHDLASAQMEERASIVQRALRNTDRYLTTRLRKTLEKHGKKF